MVILYHSYLFAIVVLIAKVVSAIGRRFPVVQGSIERAKRRVGKIAPQAVKYRLIDETSIFQKASVVAAVQISTRRQRSQYLHRGTYKSEVIWETGVAAAVGTRRRVETGDGDSH